MGGDLVAMRQVLPAAATSASEGRRLVRDLLTGAGREDLVEVAELVASELITNALLHAATPVDIHAEAGPDGLRLEVGDGSRQMPAERDYSSWAGTGRGLSLVHQLADDWGVVPTASGKVVWAEVVTAANPFDMFDDSFLDELDGVDEVGSPAREPAEVQRVPEEELGFDVVLRGVPLLMHSAWHEYAGALLREHLLAHLDRHDEESVPDHRPSNSTDRHSAPADRRLRGATADGSNESTTLAVHARAGRAMAALHDQLPIPELPTIPGELGPRVDAATLEALFAECIEPAPTLAETMVRIPRSSVEGFRALNEVMDHALAMAENDELLAMPPPPELPELRRWLCNEVLVQVNGGPPTPWRTPDDVVGRGVATRREADVDRSPSALIAADEQNRIVAASAAAVDLLGHQDPAELIGRRLVHIIPPRFHQAHLAGFTLHLTAGRRPLVAKTVTVPFLCADGTERLLDMYLQVVQTDDGRRMFLAALTTPSA
ncbi:MAG TPA: PAS domain S-box protein [Nocardioides sp.]|nr:PAS domain S-box protein [Nocardioides sp.]